MKAIINANIQKEDGTFALGNVLYDKEIIDVFCPVPDSIEIIEANGGYLTPGLIDAHCHLGMVGDSVGMESDDGNEDTDPITPHLRAIDAINPFDRGFQEAKEAGVVCVVTGPGSANAIGGQFAAIKTHGISVDDMIIKAPQSIKFALGENPKSVYSDKDDTPATRMGTMALIREALYKAKEYMEKEDADFDMKNEALIPLLEGKIPAKIHAHRADDICSAIRLKKEFGINITIEHCTDGERVLEIIKREEIPVMLGPTLTDRSKPELKNLGFSIYKAFDDAGISTAIITDHPETTIGNLRLMALLAVKNGMKKESALLSITTNAAKNTGISDKVGEIKKGLNANFALFNGHPMDFESDNILTIIDGEEVYKKAVE